MPQAWNFASLVGGLLYTAAAVASVTFVPYWILRQHGSRVVAFGFAAALALAAPTGYHVAEVLSLGVLLLAIGAFQGTLPLRLTPLAGFLGGITAIQGLVKPPTAVVAMLACALVVLAPPPGAWRRAGVAGASLLGTFLVGWLVVARQSVADLPEWALSTVDLARGYSEAMFLASTDRNHEYIAAALLVVGFIAYIARFAMRTQRRNDVLLGIVVALALWVLAKQAFVRQDGHSVLFFFVVPALATAIWTTRPASTRPLALLVATGVLLTSVSTGNALATELDPGPSLRTFLRQVTYIALPDRRQAAVDLARAQLLAEYAGWVHEPVLAEVSEASVHVDPWETSLAWAYGLDWRPVPVFQRYQAYTAKSDGDNAKALESDSRSPDKILRQDSPGLDGRNDLWDSPRYMLNLVCLYRQSDGCTALAGPRACSISVWPDASRRRETFRRKRANTRSSFVESGARRRLAGSTRAALRSAQDRPLPSRHADTRSRRGCRISCRDGGSGRPTARTGSGRGRLGCRVRRRNGV